MQMDLTEKEVKNLFYRRLMRGGEWKRLLIPLISLIIFAIASSVIGEIDQYSASQRIWIWIALSLYALMLWSQVILIDRRIERLANEQYLKKLAEDRK